MIPLRNQLTKNEELLQFLNTGFSPKYNSFNRYSDFVLKWGKEFFEINEKLRCKRGFFAKSVLNCQFCTFKDASVEPKGIHAQNFVCRKWACQCSVMSISIRTPMKRWEKITLNQIFWRYIRNIQLLIRYNRQPCFQFSFEYRKLRK